MKRLKPFLGRYLQAPKISYIMGFEEFLEVELAMADLKASVSDGDILFDEKKLKE
jgi:hypothetical protein